MAKNIFRFVIALVGGLILGQLLVIPIGIIIDKIKKMGTGTIKEFNIKHFEREKL